MNALHADIFAVWQRRQGHNVVKTKSGFWVEAGPHIFQAFPYHWAVEPDENELRSMLQEQKAIGLRYSTPYTASVGKLSYHVIYEGEDYRLEDLPKKARYDVRKGLAGVTVEPIPFSRLARESWVLRAETLARQRRTGAETQVWWQQLCASAGDLPGFEAWGALAEGQLVASLIAFTCDDCCSILYQQSRTDFLAQGVNNALTFVFTHEAIKRSQVNRIFYGLHSLDAPESVDRYKFRMRYMAKPVRQRVVFHPWLTPLLGSMSNNVIRLLTAKWPDQASLSKVEGMIRFHLEGRRPLVEQSWPKALLEQKDAILSPA